MKSINIFVLTLVLSATLTQKVQKKPAKRADICAMDAVLHMSDAGKQLAYKLTNTQISGLSSEYHEHIPGNGFETHVITETIVIHQSPVKRDSVKIAVKTDFLQKEINKELKFLNELSHHVAVLERKGNMLGKKVPKKTVKKCLVYKFNHGKANTRLSCLAREYNFNQNKIPYYRFCSKWGNGKCVNYSLVRTTNAGSPVIYCKTFGVVDGKRKCVEKASFAGKDKYMLRCEKYAKVVEKNQIRVVKKNGKLTNGVKSRKVKNVGCISFKAFRAGKNFGRKLEMRRLRTVYKRTVSKSVQVHKAVEHYSSVLFENVGKFTETDAAFVKMCM